MVALKMSLAIQIGRELSEWEKRKKSAKTTSLPPPVPQFQRFFPLLFKDNNCSVNVCTHFNSWNFWLFLLQTSTLGYFAKHL